MRLKYCFKDQKAESCETPIELYEAIKTYLEFYGGFVGDSSIVAQEAKEVALDLRKRNPNLPPIPQGDLQDIQQWCIDAQARLDKPKAKADELEGLSISKMVENFIDQNSKISCKKCVEQVNAALELKGRAANPQSIRNAFYAYKKRLKTKDI